MFDSKSKFVSALAQTHRLSSFRPAIRCRITGQDASLRKKTTKSDCRLEEQMTDEAYKKREQSFEIIRDCIFDVVHSLHELNSKESRGKA